MADVGTKRYEDAAGRVAPADLAGRYDEIRGIARRLLARNSAGRAFQATDLANEAVVKLLRAKLQAEPDAGHMLAIAARAMRQIIIDEARRQSAAKRDPHALLTMWPAGEGSGTVDLVDLDGALAALARISPERARIVELRFMLGLSVEEAAAATGLSERTVKRHWQAARAWLIATLDDRDR